jgi:ribosomal protein S18 acetylase RimI-like enzyme
VSGPSIVVADATIADAGELLTLQRAAYLSEGELHGNFRIAPLVETLAEIRSACGDGWVLKALLGTRIVGAVRGLVADGTCHIGRLAVAPDLQGRGIGSRLVSAVEDRYANEVSRFELFTGPKSEANLRLYRRLGYLDIPTPPGQEPLLYLEKRVLPSR